MSRKRLTRSALEKDPPLPQAGESLREQFVDVVLDGVMYWMLLIALVVVVALASWASWWRPTSFNPVAFTVLAILVSVIGVFKIRKRWRQARNLREGERGEIVVGQLLETLRAQGYEVFHDIAERTYNIDHVIIGPAGVFVIETKARRKSVKGDPRVTYDGQRVLVDGREPDRNPLKQARACSDRIREIIQKSTGKRPKIRPVVVYPGWWVEHPRQNVDVWVLNPKALLRFIAKEPYILKPEDVKSLAAVLGNHIRSSRIKV